MTALSALAAIRVAFGAAEPAGISGIAVWMAATAGAAGTAVGYYRALLVATRAQLAREAQTREEQAHRRAVEERLRIARELHDVFGHTMATISVQAGVGIHLLRQRPGQAVEALTTIKQISDQGLADVKTILGVLRADSDPDQPRTPQGGLGQLDALLDPVRTAGVQPQLTVHGSARPLPAAVDLAAYRILQEALTNVLRHAHARTVSSTCATSPRRWSSGSSTTERPPAPARSAPTVRMGTASAACGRGPGTVWTVHRGRTPTAASRCGAHYPPQTSHDDGMRPPMTCHPPSWRTRTGRDRRPPASPGGGA